MYTRIDKNVETCLRRFNCAPLGGKNVWALLSPLDQNKEITLAISAMDANAFFHDLAPGADVISGTVSLLAAIEALTHVCFFFDFIILLFFLLVLFYFV